MIARGTLDVKVAIPCDPQRRVIRSDAIFHEKTGIVEDKTGDRIAFSGSINETVSGWTTNWESFNCFTSWNDAGRVDAEEASFAKLWADRAPRAIVFDVPSAVREKLIGFMPEGDRPPRRIIELENEIDPKKTGVVRQRLRTSDGSTLEAPDKSIDEERWEIWRRHRQSGEATQRRRTRWRSHLGNRSLAYQIRAFQRLYDHLATEAPNRRRGGPREDHSSWAAVAPGMAGRTDQARHCPRAQVCVQTMADRVAREIQSELADLRRSKLIWYPRRQAPFGRTARFCKIGTASRSSSCRAILRAGRIAAPSFLRPRSHGSGGARRGPSRPPAGRRDGAGKRPDAPLRLRRDLRNRTSGLLLLTAHPFKFTQWSFGTCLLSWPTTGLDRTGIRPLLSGDREGCRHKRLTRMAVGAVSGI